MSTIRLLRSREKFHSYNKSNKRGMRARRLCKPRSNGWRTKKKSSSDKNSKSSKRSWIKFSNKCKQKRLERFERKKRSCKNERNTVKPSLSLHWVLKDHFWVGQNHHGNLNFSKFKFSSCDSIISQARYWKSSVTLKSKTKDRNWSCNSILKTREWRRSSKANCWKSKPGSSNTCKTCRDRIWRQNSSVTERDRRKAGNEKYKTR